MLQFFFVRASVGSYVVFCFVIVCSSSLLLLVPRECNISWVYSIIFLISKIQSELSET